MDVFQLFTVSKVLVRSEGADVPHEERLVVFQAGLELDGSGGMQA